MPVFADMIGANGCVGGVCPGTLDVFSNLPGTLLASATDSRWNAYDAQGNALYGGVLRSAVYKNAGNTLDFYYQFASSGNSIDSVGRMTMTNFAGFTTNVGYRMDNWDDTTGFSGQFLAATQAPVSADRSSSGGTVGFSFYGRGGAIDPSETSATLVIRTNAYDFTAGSLTTQNGAVYTTNAFAPTTLSGVPEPGTYVLIGAGLIAIAGFRRRK